MQCALLRLQVNGPKERRDRRKVRQLATVTEATPLTQALGHLLQVRLVCMTFRCLPTCLVSFHTQ